MSAPSVVGPVLLAILLPLLVVWVAQVFGSGLSLFTVQVEIDRWLRENPGSKPRRWLVPWRREADIVALCRRLAPGRQREAVLALIVRHTRALDMQAGLSGLACLGVLVAWRGEGLVLAAVALVILVLLGWRVRAHRHLASTG